MVFEKYLRQKKIEKEATEVASKSVNEVLSSSYMRSEFEKIEWVKERLNHVWWSQEKGYCDTGKHPRANASFLNGAWSMHQHQQSKVDELQKRVDESLRILVDIKKKGLIGSQYSIFDLEQVLKGGPDE